MCTGFFTWQICKALAFTELPRIDGPSRALEAGWLASRLGWARLARPVLLSRDSRTCRAPTIPGKTRDRVATSRTLGTKCACGSARLARATRYVAGKDVVFSRLAEDESFICRDSLSRQVLARIHEVHMAPVFGTGTTSHHYPRMGRSVPLP